MNVKRYLKKKAEEDRKKILTADDGAFLRSLQEKVETTPAPEKRRARAKLKYWLPAAASAVAAAIVITCVVVYYPFEPGHVEYLDGNIVIEDATIDELNKDMKEIDLSIDESLYSCAVSKMTDSVSGDVLYYTAKIDSFDTFIHINLVTVCNPYYKYKNFVISGEPVIATLEHYSVSYKATTAIDDQFGLEILQAAAQIHKGKEFIYVTSYSELLLSPDGSFLEILQSIVK